MKEAERLLLALAFFLPLALGIYGLATGNLPLSLLLLLDILFLIALHPQTAERLAQLTSTILERIPKLASKLVSKYFKEVTIPEVERVRTVHDVLKEHPNTWVIDVASTKATLDTPGNLILWRHEVEGVRSPDIPTITLPQNPRARGYILQFLTGGRVVDLTPVRYKEASAEEGIMIVTKEGETYALVPEVPYTSEELGKIYYSLSKYALRRKHI